jgi:hypothetical protein
MGVIELTDEGVGPGLRGGRAQGGINTSHSQGDICYMPT